MRKVESCLAEKSNLAVSIIYAEMQRIKSGLLLVIIFIFVFDKTGGSEQLGQVYEIKTDIFFEHVLNSAYWQVLEDKTGT